MKSTLKINKTLIAWLCAIALQLPLSIQLAHAVEGHKHIACSDFKAHIHQKANVCNICDFHFSNFDFKVQELPQFMVFHIYRKPVSDYISSYYFTEVYHNHLRGPPYFS